MLDTITYMVPRTLTDCSPLLLDIAKQVCREEGVDFDALDLHQAGGLLYFWCVTCRRTYPLTDLIISKLYKVCVHCKASVKLPGASNKFGKLRRRIFYRVLSDAMRMCEAADQLVTVG